MKLRIKRTLSFLVTLTMLLSLMVFPASAAVSVTAGFEKTDDPYTVNVTLTSSDNQKFDTNSVELHIQFDNTQLALDSVTPLLTGFANGSSAIATANTKGEYVLLFYDSNGDNHAVSGAIAELKFKKASDTVENGDITLAFAGESAVGYYDENDPEAGYTVSDSATYTLSITDGALPTINTVTLATSSVMVDGATAVSPIQATATSTSNKDITGGVEWSVSPTNQGVTIATDGKITVDSKAKADSYTVSAKAVANKSQGDAKTALTVTRATAKATKMEILSDGEVKTGSDTIGIPGSRTYTVALKDQYGDDFNGTAELKLSDTAGFSPPVNGVVTVADTTADKAQATLTATYGNLTATLTIVASKLQPAWPTAKESVVYGTARKDMFTNWSDTGTGKAIVGNEEKTLNGKFEIVTASGDPTLLPAGDQTVTVKFTVTDEGDYKNSVTETFNVKVTKLEKEVKWSVPTLTYTGSALTNLPTATIDGVDGNAVTLSVQIDKATVQDAGKYNATASLSAADAANYSLKSNTTEFKVAPKKVTPTVTLLTTSAEWTDAKLSEVSYTVKDGETVIDAEEYFGEWNPPTVTGIGPYTLTITDNNPNGNYDIAKVTATFEATKPQVWVSGITAKDKVYDGKTTAELDLTNVVLKDKNDQPISADLLTVEATGAFADKNVGTQKSVAITLKLAGTKANDFALATDNQQTTATAAIKPAEVTVSGGITAKDKVYDGTTAVELDSSKATIAGAVAGDDLSVVVYGAFADANVGTAKPITVTIQGVTLGGADKDNYVVKSDMNLEELNLSAAIKAKTVKLTGVTASYDTSAQEVVFANGKLDGKIDKTDLDFTYNTVGKLDPGTQTVKCAPTLTGKDKDNYTLDPTEYDVTVNVPQENTEVANVETTGTDGASVEDAAPGETGSIKEAAEAVAADKTIIDAAKTEAATELGADKKDVEVAVKPIVNVKTEENADDANKVDITVEAQYQLTGTDGTTTKDLGEPKPMNISSAVKVKVPVDTTKFPKNTTAFVTQTVGGKTYEYEAQIDNDGNAVFEAENGLNEKATFTLSKDSEAKFKIGSASYDTLQAAVDAVKDGETITVMANSTDTATVSKSVSFTLDKNGKTFTGSIAAGSGCTLKEENGVYTATKQSSSGGGGGGGGTPVAQSKVGTGGSSPYGSLSYSNTYAKPGEKQTVTAYPIAGYTLASISAKDEKGNDVPLTKNADGTYSFTMPADGSKVTVTPVFEKSGQFIDVPANEFYTDAVAWAVSKGITNGKGSANTFKPNDTCTRAEVVTFLYRAAGSPDVAANTNFTDVPANEYYAKAVAWAVANGITNGTGDGKTFSPNAKCSRAQIVTFLFRFEKGTAAANSFKDVPANEYYAGAVGWAVAKGVTNGTGDGTTFSPNADCTRGQIVTFLYRDFANK